jgi:hypothetical protein
MLPNFPPVGRWQNQNCQLPAGDVLLVAQVLIHGDEDFKPTLGGAQQICVLQVGPTRLKRGGNFVPRGRAAERCGRALIEEDAHGIARSSAGTSTSSGRRPLANL